VNKIDNSCISRSQGCGTPFQNRYGKSPRAVRDGLPPHFFYFKHCHRYKPILN